MTTMPPPLPAPDLPSSTHKPFSWLEETEMRSASASDIAAAMDVFRGIATCLELVEMSNLDRAMAGPSSLGMITPTLDRRDTGRLLRLAIVAANEWGDKFEDQLSSGDNNNSRGAQ